MSMTAQKFIPPFGTGLFLLLLSACNTKPAPANADTRVEEAAEPARARASSEAHALCTADPGGSSFTDQDIRTASAIIEKIPTKIDAWVLAGRAWVKKARITVDPGFYLHADRCADGALALQKDFAPALQLKALALLNDHRFEEARALAQDLVSRDPYDTIALGALSDALLELGLFEAANDPVERMLKVKPDIAGYTRGSYLKWLTGDRSMSKELMRLALGSAKDIRDPEPTAWTFTQAALIFWNEGDYTGADHVLDEALKWVPDYPHALIAKGRVALSLEQPKRATELLERALESSRLGEAAWLLADAKELAGDREGARAALDRAIELAKQSDKLLLAQLYATKDRDHDEALRAIEAERRTRGGVYLDDVYAWALFRAGRLSEARDYSDRSLRLGTKDARLLYHAGAIRIAQGEIESGSKLIEEALALSPRFDLTGAREARELLMKHAKKR
jgi:Flp pilus assembly protein TadD